jgi:hypothetical protein
MIFSPLEKETLLAGVSVGEESFSADLSHLLRDLLASVSAARRGKKRVA